MLMITWAGAPESTNSVRRMAIPANSCNASCMRWPWLRESGSGWQASVPGPCTGRGAERGLSQDSSSAPQAGVNRPTAR